MIADLAKREANLLDMREGGEIDRAELLRRIGPVRTDLARAKERLRQLDGWQLGSLPALATEVRTLLTGLDLVNLTPSELAPLVAVLVERIVIEAGSVRVVWKPGVAELFGEIT